MNVSLPLFTCFFAGLKHGIRVQSTSHSISLVAIFKIDKQTFVTIHAKEQGVSSAILMRFIFAGKCPYSHLIDYFITVSMVIVVDSNETIYKLHN